MDFRFICGLLMLWMILGRWIGVEPQAELWLSMASQDEKKKKENTMFVLCFCLFVCLLYIYIYML